jgi:membrane protease YdiL (CAAX protease family)
MLGTAVLVWAVLLALEILFWVEPMAGLWRTVQQRVYRRPGLVYIVPFWYVLRLAAVAVILTTTGMWGNVVTWAAMFGVSWSATLTSLGLGLALGMVTVASALAKPRQSWKQLAAAVCRRPHDALYILFWVSGVEEFLYRGLLISLLAPETGAWAIPLSSFANLICHVPVWLVYAAQPGRAKGAFRQMFLVGAALSLLFGAIYYATGSLLGPIIAHFAADVGNLAGAAERENRDRGSA